MKLGSTLLLFRHFFQDINHNKNSILDPTKLLQFRSNEPGRFRRRIFSQTDREVLQIIFQ